MNFVFALIIASISVIGGSLVWPKLTAQPRPAALTQVRNAVIGTPVGKQAAEVLGVTDESHVQPVSVGQMVSGAIGAGERVIQDRIQYIIVQNAVRQLQSQIDKLPKDEQSEIRQQLCAPPEKK